MQNNESWYKEHESDKVWWLDQPDIIGEFVFSFDKKEQFNLFADYPHKLSKHEREIFDRENPFWANFFKDRG